MKKNKLSALEKVQLEKIRLHAEANNHAYILDHRINYLQSNFTHLLGNTLIAAAAAKFPFIQNFIPDKSSSSEIKLKTKTEGNNSIMSTVTDQAIDLLPLLFKGSKPIIVAFLLKQIKKIVLGKIKK